MVLPVIAKCQDLKQLLAKAYASADSSDYFFAMAKKKITGKADEAEYLYCKNARFTDHQVIDSSTYYGLKTIALCKEIQNNNLMLNVYRNIANVNSNNGKYDVAAHYALEGLRIAEKLNDLFWITRLNIVQSIIQHDFESYAEGIYYGKKAYENSLKLNPHNFIFTSYALNAIAINFDDWNKPDSALYYHKKIFSYAKGDDTLSMEGTYNNIGNTLMKQKKYDEAAGWLERALNINLIRLRKQGGVERIDIAYDLATVYTNLATIAYIQDDFAKAENIFEKAKYYSEKSGNVEKLRDYYQQRYLFNKKRKNTDETALYQEMYISLRDSVFNSARAKTFADLEKKYQTEKKETQIKLLSAENFLQRTILEKNKILLYANKLELDKKTLQLGNQQLLISNQGLELQKNQILLVKNDLELKNKEQRINILNLNDKNKSLEIQKKNRQLLFGLAAVLLLTALAYSFYKRYKLRQKAKLQEAVIREQDEAAKAVINAEENERQRMSATLHDGLGQLLSVIKMNLQSVEETVSLNEKTAPVFSNALNLVDASIREMRNVSHQIVTNNVLRSGLGNALKELIEKIDSSRLKINLEVDGLVQHIHPDVQLVLYRIFQESINNVIKHAQADVLNILIKIAPDQIRGEITDNGKGFNTSNVHAGRGIGLENIATRIKFLRGEHTIQSVPGQGTTLQFQVPL